MTLQVLQPTMRQQLRNKLVGYWPLEEASGTRRVAMWGGEYPVGATGLDWADNNTVTGNPGPSSNLRLASQFTAVTTEFLQLGWIKEGDWKNPSSRCQ